MGTEVHCSCCSPHFASCFHLMEVHFGQKEHDGSQFEISKSLSSLQSISPQGSLTSVRELIREDPMFHIMAIWLERLTSPF